MEITRLSTPEMTEKVTTNKSPSNPNEVIHFSSSRLCPTQIYNTVEWLIFP